MTDDCSHPLFTLLRRLDAGAHHYTLSRTVLDAVLVTVTFVGERTEISIFEDGHMEVSRFTGTEDVLGGSELVEQLLTAAEEEESHQPPRISRPAE
jgi:hypothetical protein